MDATVTAGRTLLLNASYEPLCVITLRRAVVLVLAERAEIVEADDTARVRSEFVAVPAPKVVRLVRYVSVPYHRPLPLTRRAVLARDGHSCCYCGRRASTVDHVTPRSRGGRHIWGNVVAACSPCNNRKGDHTPAELGWAMRFEPWVPSGRLRVVVAVGRVDPSWSRWMHPDREVATAV